MVPLASLNRIKAQLEAMKVEMDEKEAEHRKAVDKLEEEIVHLQGQLADAHEELDDCKEQLEMYEENRDTRREALMEKEITTLHTQLRVAVKERDTLEVVVQSVQDEYARSTTSGLSKRAFEALSNLMASNSGAAMSPRRADGGDDGDGGAAGGEEKSVAFETPGHSSAVVAGAADLARNNLAAITMMQQANAREEELKRQLTKTKKEKERAMKVIMCIIGKDRLQEHLRLHSGQQDILTSLVEAVAPGGNLSHIHSGLKYVNLVSSGHLSTLSIT